MTASGAASPAPDEAAPEASDAPSGLAVLPLSVPPTLDDLRVALRPPALPLPRPETVLEAAHRIDDLTAAGRLKDARALSLAMAHEPGDLAERVELLRAAARSRRAAGREDEARTLLREMVALIDGSGRREHARAAAIVHGVIESSAPEADDAAASPTPRGRRRKDPLRGVADGDVDEAVLAVVRGIADPGLARRERPDDRALELAEGRMLSALAAYPESAPAIIGDPEPILRLRLGRILLAQERWAEASEQARILLEDLAARDPQPSDLARLGSAAHAQLAIALRPGDPGRAAAHACVALTAMQYVDQPAERIDLICELVESLVVGGIPVQAAYAARRLSSLLRTLADSSDRPRPLRTIAAERISAGVLDEAGPLLAEARRIARRDHDHRELLSIDRLSAEAMRRAERPEDALAALRSAAADARYLTDDLGASCADREHFQRIELAIRSDAVRLALDADLAAQARAEAEGIIARLDRISGRPVLPAQEMWEHEVDARIGALIAADLDGALGSGGAAKDARRLHRRLRRVAFETIEAAPEAARDRVPFWTTYLHDREAVMLERMGQSMAALVAARAARDGWAELGEQEHADRAAELVARLEHAG